MKANHVNDAIGEFLDAADKVLNSNTFLVELPLPSPNPVRTMDEFIRSGGLHEALFAADITRGWYNLHRFTAGGALKPVGGNFSRPDCRLTMRPNRYTAEDYLAAILTADMRLGDFISFYHCEKDPDEAKKLVRRLLARLFPGMMPTLYVFEPDFLLGEAVAAGGPYYFEEKGCDNAALLAGKTAGYLLLTNGTP